MPQRRGQLTRSQVSLCALVGLAQRDEHQPSSRRRSFGERLAVVNFLCSSGS